MLPDGRIKARIVDAKGKFREIGTVCVAGNDIQIWKSQTRREQAVYQKKLSQTFGSETLALLRSMKVGIVGCSGTGSLVIELLARNCIGELVIVDDDIVEEKNLNRIVNSTADAARKQEAKVIAIKRAVKRAGTGTKVSAFQCTTDSPKAMAALVDCDVIFGCVDSAYGRYHLDCLASAHLIPYFDVGVHLEADGKGGITSADAVSHYISPEGESLLSRGGYSMEQVTAENWRRKDPKYYNQQRMAGYLAEVGEERPAVMSINMQAACLAFNDFMARIHNYRLDENREFAMQRFRLVHGHYDNEADQACVHPLMEPYVGLGDKSLLVKNNLES